IATVSSDGKPDVAPSGSPSKVAAFLLAAWISQAHVDGFWCWFGKLLNLNAAGVAKLAYAADSKWEFCSFCPLRNSSQSLDPAKENDPDALKPFARLLGNF